MEQLDSGLLEAFTEESLELLGEFEKTVLGLEAAPRDEELIHLAFRDLHTLKGSAAMFGFELMEDFTHQAENVFAELRSGSLLCSSEIIQWSLNAVDVINRLITTAAPDSEYDEALTNRVGQLLDEGLKFVGGSAQDFEVETVDAAAGEPAADGGAAASAGEETRVELDLSRTIKVKAERLDSLQNLVGELVTLNLNLAHTARLKQDEDFIGLSDKQERVLRDLRMLAGELHMVPVGTLFASYRRPVRDIALRCGKTVNLKTAGEETEFDRGIYAGLSEPLLHLIRNAVDHGIEPPDDRLAMGKSPEGEIVLEAFYRGSNGIIRIKDDGRGIDPEAVRLKAIEKGLLTEADEPTPGELFELLYSPGFSTAGSVSNVSGRGVGMDVVKKGIQALRGQISIESEPGEGTVITISLPLSISSTEGLLVIVDGIRYLIPLGCVQECLFAEEASFERGMMRYRDRMISCVDLKAFFSDGAACSGESAGVTIVISEGGKDVGLVVDEISGIFASVVKPLPAIFRSVPYFSGSSLLGDGSAAFMLDITELLRNL